MKKFAVLTITISLFAASIFQTSCANTKKEAILNQLDAISGATKFSKKRPHQ